MYLHCETNVIWAFKHVTINKWYNKNNETPKCFQTSNIHVNVNKEQISNFGALHNKAM